MTTTHSPTSTSIVVVEDVAALAYEVSEQLGEHQADLQPFGLAGPIHIVGTLFHLSKWLDKQPHRSVRLLILDYALQGDSTGVDVLKLMRNPATKAWLHPAFHPSAMCVGWSAIGPKAITEMQRHGADSFISKHRKTPFIEDLITVLKQHPHWIALHEWDE